LKQITYLPPPPSKTISTEMVTECEKLHSKKGKLKRKEG